MTNTNNHNRSGFTLIELLFIIAIIGFLTALIISSYQQRTGNQKITRGAVQMQQILQAGVAYYNDIHCWPSTSTGCSSPNPPDFKKYYIPVGGSVSPWQQNYQYSTSPDGVYFIVSSPNVPPQAAHRMAALLPNGTATNCSSRACLVTTTIGINNNFALAGIGDIYKIKDDSHLYTNGFQCPIGLAKMGAEIVLASIEAHGYDQYCLNVRSRMVQKIRAKNLTCTTKAPFYCEFDFEATSKNPYPRHPDWDPACVDPVPKQKEFGDIGVTYLNYCYRQ